MKALTGTQSHSVAAETDLSATFLLKAVQRSPELWENTSFRIGVEFIIAAATTCKQRMFPNASETIPTLEDFEDAVTQSQLSKVS